MSHINYETDTPKHYVRTDGWLKAAKEQKSAVRSRSKKMRYFTFCAAKAIDVFMLERAGILNRDGKTGRLEGVYFCEKNDEDFGEIAELIGSPNHGFRGELEKIVLFEDDEDTEGKALLDEDENLHPDEVRKKLRNKNAHWKLREAFPFDIINFDMEGNMFPRVNTTIARMLESILQILKWQTEARFPNNRECKRFTLFLTAHIEQPVTNQNAIEELEGRLSDNIASSEDFRKAFVKRYCHDNAAKLICENFAEFFSLALPKFMIYRVLHDLGWKVTCSPTYLYTRERKKNEQYQIMHTVSVYERIPNFQQSLDVPNMRQYIQAITQLVENTVKWVDKILTPERKQELEEDLKQIINFRNSRST